MNETVDGINWLISRISIFMCAVLSSVCAVTGVFVLYGGIMKNELSARFSALIPSGEPFTSAVILIAAAFAGAFALWCLNRCVMVAVPLTDAIKDIAVALFFYRMFGNMKPLLFIAAIGTGYFILSAVMTVRIIIKSKGGNNNVAD